VIDGLRRDRDEARAQRDATLAALEARPVAAVCNDARACQLARDDAKRRIDGLCESLEKMCAQRDAADADLKQIAPELAAVRAECAEWRMQAEAGWTCAGCGYRGPGIDLTAGRALCHKCADLRDAARDARVAQAAVVEPLRCLGCGSTWTAKTLDQLTTDITMRGRVCCRSTLAQFRGRP
jgi:hypothetical protein